MSCVRVAGLAVVWVMFIQKIAATNPTVLPSPSNWVSNPDGILSPEAVYNMSRLLNASLNVTMDCQGQLLPYQIAMVTVHSIDSHWTPQTFAQTLMDRWGVGYAACNNGVIGLVSIADRHWYILTGSGVPSQLEIDTIMSSVLPLLRLFQYDQALVKMTENILEALRLAKPDSSSSSGLTLPLLAVVVVLPVLFGCWMLIMLPKCISNPQMQDVHSSSQTESIVPLDTRVQPGSPLNACPICLKEFPSGVCSNFEWNQTLATQHKLVLATCGHPFHTRCLKRWNERLQTLTCPVCNVPLNIPTASSTLKVVSWDDSKNYAFMTNRYRTQGTSLDPLILIIHHNNNYHDNNYHNNNHHTSHDNTGSSMDYGGGSSVDSGGGGGDW